MRVPEHQACSGNGAVTASLWGMERAGEECQEGLGVPISSCHNCMSLFLGTLLNLIGPFICPCVNILY